MIRAVLVQAGTAGLGPSLQHLLELQRGPGNPQCWLPATP